MFPPRHARLSRRCSGLLLSQSVCVTVCLVREGLTHGCNHVSAPHKCVYFVFVPRVIRPLEPTLFVLSFKRAEQEFPFHLHIYFFDLKHKICSGAVSTDLIWGGNRGLKCQNDLYLWSSTFISVSSGEWKIYGIFHSTKMWSLNKKSFSNPEFWPKMIR